MLVTSIGPSSINTCALMIFIQCTQGSDSQAHGIRFDNLIGLITHLIILSHVHPASDYSLAGSDSLVMPVKDDGDGKWVLPRASRPVVFQGEHLTQCTLDTQVAGRVVTSHSPENPVCNVGGWVVRWVGLEVDVNYTTTTNNNVISYSSARSQG